MEDIVVTRFWMAGVVAMMLVFGAIAMFGHFRQKSGGGTGEKQGSGPSSGESQE